jgi:hypothetical protein
VYNTEGGSQALQAMSWTKKNTMTSKTFHLETANAISTPRLLPGTAKT